MAQRAVTSYVRSCFLQPRRQVFDVSRLPLPEYAASMGLLAAPRLRFLPHGVGKGAAPSGQRRLLLNDFRQLSSCGSIRRPAAVQHLKGTALPTLLRMPQIEL